MDNKNISRQLVEEVWNQNKTDLIDRLVSPKWIDHHPQATDGVRGTNGYKTLVQGYRTAFPDMKMVVEQQIGEGDLVCTQWRAIGTNSGRFMDMNPTNRRVEITGTTIDRYEGGKLVETWDNYDALDMMQQLGFVPKNLNQPTPPTERRPSAK